MLAKEGRKLLTVLKSVNRRIFLSNFNNITLGSKTRLLCILRPKLGWRLSDEWFLTAKIKAQVFYCSFVFAGCSRHP